MRLNKGRLNNNEINDYLQLYMCYMKDQQVFINQQLLKSNRLIKHNDPSITVINLGVCV